MSFPLHLMRFGRVQRLLSVAILSMLLLVFQIVPTSHSAAQSSPRSDFRVALITDALGGTIHDGTFNETAYNGLVKAGKDFNLTVSYSESNDVKDYEPSIQSFIDQGFNIIVTVSFDTQAVTEQFAEKYPKVYFIGIDQAADGKATSNYVGISFREDEGGFLAGALAGMMTHSNVVGVVGGVQIPPVVRFVNGFINGVKYTNATAQALSVYTSAFDNVDEGQQKARDMIDQKADVVFGAGGLTGSSAILLAAQFGIYVIGVDQDEYRTTFRNGKSDPVAAARILTSSIKRVDTGVYDLVNDILNNRFTPGTRLFSAASCGIIYAPFHDADNVIPTDVKAKLASIWSQLAGGVLQTGAAGDLLPPAPTQAATANATATSGPLPKLSDCQ